MGGIFSQPPMKVFPKEAIEDGRVRYRTIQDIQAERQLMEIVKSWDDDDDFHIISDMDVPPIDSKLISEDLFLAQHPGHVRVSITIPMDECNLKSPLTISTIIHGIDVECLSETVSSLKHRIAQKIGISPSKQKLISLKSGVLEDHLSLAYYNVGGHDYRLFLSIEDRVTRRSLRSPVSDRPIFHLGHPMKSTKADDVKRARDYLQATQRLEEIIKSWEGYDDCDLLRGEDVPPIDSTLISEDLFLAQHPGHVLVYVTIPTDCSVKSHPVMLSSIKDTIDVESLSETVSSFKDRIDQKIGVSPSNQKLVSLKSGVLEDHLSLAYYNVGGHDYKLFLSIEDGVARRSLLEVILSEE